MKRALITTFSLLLILPAFALAWLLTTESGLHWAFAQGKAYLPGQLSIGRLEGLLVGPIVARNVSYEQQDVTLQAQQLRLEWRPATLLAASLHIDSLHVRALQLDLPPTAPTGNGDQAMRLPEIHLPWRVNLKEVVVDQLTVRREQQTFTTKRLSLAGSGLFNRLELDKLRIETDDFDIALKGTLHPVQSYRHALDLNWRFTLPNKVVVNGAGHVEGDMAASKLSQRLSGPLQLNLEGEVRGLLAKTNWQANISAQTDSLALLDERLPTAKGRLHLEAAGDLQQATIEGRLSGRHPATGPVDARFQLQRLADNIIRIDSLNLLATESETRLFTRGSWTPGPQGGSVDLAFSWQNLRWPLKNQAWFSSTIGSAWLQGDLQHYRAGMATDRPWQQAPPSHWYASAQGDRQGLDFHSLRITALNGETLARGRLDWTPKLQWQAEVQAADIDPATLWPAWPGRLKGKLTTSGDYQNQQLTVAARVARIEGRLRGYPVSLRSQLAWRDKGLDIGYLDFRSGTSSVTLQGRAADTLALDWRIDADNLTELYPDAQGQLRAMGKLSGPRAAPTIAATLHGRALRLPGYAIDMVEGEVVLDLYQWQQINIHLAAQGLLLKDYALHTLEVQADGQRLAAKATTDDISAQIQLQGEAVDDAWRGHVVGIDIQGRRFEPWQLQAPASLHISRNSLRLEDLCLHQGEARLCATLSRDQQSWRSKLDLQQAPLSLLSTWLPPELDLDGVARGTATLQWQQAERLVGQTQLQLTTGAINYLVLEGERERWEFSRGTLVMQLDDAGLESRAELALRNGDLLKASLSLPEANLLAWDPQQPLRATAQLDTQALGLLEILVPEVHDLRGELAMNLTATGTVAKPWLKGQVQLRNGAMRIPRLGVHIDQLTLSGQSSGLEKLQFQLQARSGDGALTIQGQTMLDKDAGWPTELSIQGNEFEVSRIPEARVLISPELRVTLQGRTIHVDGQVHIPYANLQPKDISTAVRVSQDAVIIDSQQAVAEKWSIFTRIRLTLSERVSLHGYGFDGRLGGSLLLEDEPGQPTRATGEITVLEGRYRAYGQRLEVEQGRLLYTGGPLTNPGLDLRAVRQVGEVVAGLRVKGTLSQPQVELFSIPVMGQTNALAYLLLGRPIESASGEEGAMLTNAALALGLTGGDHLARSLGERFGLDEIRVEGGGTGDQASLVMGRYLSPKLYVGYSVGLIEAINTLTVRYQMSRHWQLRGESGEYQGADLLYTIER